MEIQTHNSPNQSSRKGYNVEGVVGHYTAGGGFNATVRYLCNKTPAPAGSKGRSFVQQGSRSYYNARASAHYVTGRRGQIARLVPEGKAAWHSGSKKTVPKFKGKPKVNLRTIGHEICNWGPLIRKGDSFFTHLSGWNFRYKGPTPVRYEFAIPKNFGKILKYSNGTPVFPDGIIEYWEPYTDEQVESTISLWTDIADRYDLTAEDFVGHSDTDPTRKLDPGPLFPWNDILDGVFSFRDVEEVTEVNYPDPQEITMAANLVGEDRLVQSNGLSALLNRCFR